MCVAGVNLPLCKGPNRKINSGKANTKWEELECAL